MYIDYVTIMIILCHGGFSLDKKELQRKRMLTYFVEATNEIIEKEGLKNVTIRKIADIAGYNSATLYNYFENLDHLIFFASMKYFKDYYLGISSYINGIEDEMEVFLKIWEFFCTHSFSNPKIFYNIFFSKHKDKLKETIQEYYDIFPEEFGEHNNQINDMLMGKNIYERNIVILQPLVNSGIISKNDIDTINNIIVFTYQSMLHDIVILGESYEVEEVTKKILEIIIYALKK